LEFSPADAVFHRQVLERLQEELNAFHAFELGLHAANDSVAEILRTSSGFRLIWMRPEFSVVLVPSTPMNEEMLSTAGS
jgi:hypothetical protein